MDQRPNIFLFVMDTARAKSLSAYGYERDTTPFLERCAEEGFRFENAIANSIWTYPSHVSMFTGMYPHEHERISKHDKGEIFFDSFVEELSEEGYDTIGISNNGWVSHVFGFDGFFDEFEMKTGRKTYLFDDAPLLKEFEKKEVEGGWDSRLDKYSEFFRRAFIERRPKSVLNGVHYLFKHKVFEKFSSEDFWSDDGAEKVLEDFKSMDFDSDNPKFTFVNFIEPHSSYTPPRSFAEKFYDGDIDEERDLLDRAPSDFLGQEDEEKAEVLKDFYDASLNYMDYMLEKIHEEVEDNTERENVFIFLGDHGEMFNSQGLWAHHGGFRREVLRVPLIIKGYKQGEEDDLFELRKIGDLVNSIIKGEALDFGDEEAYSDYLGLNSHMFDEEGLPEGFNNPKSARITSDNLEVSSSLDMAEGELKEHMRALKMKKNRNNI
jgi:arylsulfatase A-like enzyme